MIRESLDWRGFSGTRLSSELEAWHAQPIDEIAFFRIPDIRHQRSWFDRAKDILLDIRTCS